MTTTAPLAPARFTTGRPAVDVAPAARVPVLRGAGLAVTVLACLPVAGIGLVGLVFAAAAGSVVALTLAGLFLALSVVWPAVFWRVTRRARTAGGVVAPLLPGLLVILYAVVQCAVAGA